MVLLKIHGSTKKWWVHKIIMGTKESVESGSGLGQWNNLVLLSLSFFFSGKSDDAGWSFDGMVSFWQDFSRFFASLTVWNVRWRIYQSFVCYCAKTPAHRFSRKRSSGLVMHSWDTDRLKKWKIHPFGPILFLWTHGFAKDPFEQIMDPWKSNGPAK